MSLSQGTMLKLFFKQEMTFTYNLPANGAMGRDEDVKFEDF